MIETIVHLPEQLMHVLEFGKYWIGVGVLVAGWLVTVQYCREVAGRPAQRDRHGGECPGLPTAGAQVVRQLPDCAQRRPRLGGQIGEGHSGLAEPLRDRARYRVPALLHAVTSGSIRRRLSVSLALMQLLITLDN